MIKFYFFFPSVFLLPVCSHVRDFGAVLVVLVAGPQCEVVAEQLHDQRRVLVGLLRERVELGDGVVEGLLGQRARLLRLGLDLVQEDGVVERQPQPDRVRGRELGRLFRGLVVRLGRVLRVVVLDCALGELGQVAVVVCGRGMARARAL